MKRICFALLAVLLFAGVTHACPMCKDSIPNSDVGGAVAVPTGFNASVYTMLVGFLAMLGLISGIIWKGVSETSVQRGFTPKMDAKKPDSDQAE